MTEKKIWAPKPSCLAPTIDYRKILLASLWFVFSILPFFLWGLYEQNNIINDTLQKIKEHQNIFILWVLLCWFLSGGALYYALAVEIYTEERISVFKTLKYALKHYQRFFFSFFVVLFFLLILYFVRLGIQWIFFETCVDAIGRLLLLPVNFLLILILFACFTCPGFLCCCITIDDLDSYDAVSRSLMFLFHCTRQWIWQSILVFFHVLPSLFFACICIVGTIFFTWNIYEECLLFCITEEINYVLLLTIFFVFCWFIVCKAYMKILVYQKLRKFLTGIEENVWNGIAPASRWSKDSLLPKTPEQITQEGIQTYNEHQKQNLENKTQEEQEHQKQNLENKTQDLENEEK
ncbi:MAG: hypothetical protein KBC30_08440 [Planctomycetes bacterium]|nr:hypothetical protein [Planctomycetota bacterium]